jgi:hypothetical protein
MQPPPAAAAVPTVALATIELHDGHSMHSKSTGGGGGDVRVDVAALSVSSGSQIGSHGMSVTLQVGRARAVQQLGRDQRAAWAMPGHWSCGCRLQLAA